MLLSDEEINALFTNLHKHWNKLDILIHSVAYAPADQISGDFIECTNREGFRIAHDISAYSLVGFAQAALPMMENTQGSILTLSYYGAEKAVPNYNVMGIAKAAWKLQCVIWQQVLVHEDYESMPSLQGQLKL